MNTIEQLENRRMFAVLVGTEIHVTGTEAADVIRITQNDATTLRIEENGVVTFFNDTNVTLVKVDAKGGNDRVTYVEQNGTVANDRAHLIGGEGNDTLTGGAGGDIIEGNAGNDVINGGGGSDRIDGGAGNNTMNGDGGNDFLKAAGGNDIYNGGAGTDTADYGDRTTSVNITLDGVANDGRPALRSLNGLTILQPGESDNVAADIENVTTGSGDDVITGQAATVNNVFRSGAGNDRLRGRAGNDRFEAGAGNDSLIGEGGNDIMLGEAGDDVMLGQAGNDTLTGGDGNDIMSGGIGIDQLRGEAGNDVLLAVDLAIDSVLDGGAGFDILDADSNETGVNNELLD